MKLNNDLRDIIVIATSDTSEDSGYVFTINSIRHTAKEFFLMLESNIDNILTNYRYKIVYNNAIYTYIGPRNYDIYDGFSFSNGTSETDDHEIGGGIIAKYLYLYCDTDYEDPEDYSYHCSIIEENIPIKGDIPNYYRHCIIINYPTDSSNKSTSISLMIISRAGYAFSKNIVYNWLKNNGYVTEGNLFYTSFNKPYSCSGVFGFSNSTTNRWIITGVGANHSKSNKLALVGYSLNSAEAGITIITDLDIAGDSVTITDICTQINY